MKRRKATAHWLVGMYFLLASVWVDSLYVKTPLICAGVFFFGLAWRADRLNAKALRAERERELAKEKTRELEKELGFEPINFQELSDDEVNRMYEELKKEKGTET